jgi:hypothetical protein
MTGNNEVFIDTDEKDEKGPPVTITSDGDNTEVRIEEKPKAAKSEDADERLRAAERDQAQLRAQLADMQYRFAGQQPNVPQIDPYSAEEDRISEQEKALGIQYDALRASGGLTNQLITDFDKKARGLQQQRINLGTQRAIQAVLPAINNSQQQQYFRTQYMDVHQNPRALQYAKGVYDQLIALGETDGPQLVDRAMNESRSKFGLTGGTKFMPSEKDKAQFAGVGGNGGKASTSNVVKMGKAEKQMALAMYGNAYNGDEKKVFAAWAKGPGLRAKKQADKMRRNG